MTLPKTPQEHRFHRKERGSFDVYLLGDVAHFHPCFQCTLTLGGVYWRPCLKYLGVSIAEEEV